MSISIAEVSVEHHHSGFAIFHSRPRLSWRFNSTNVKGWTQASYSLALSRNGKEEIYDVTSSDSILVPWPSTPLSSREVVHVKVRATGEDGLSTKWASLRLEVALLERSQWKSTLISSPAQDKDEPKRPFRLRKAFHCSASGASNASRLYATAHGIYQVEINGKVVGDELLTPGWQSYKHRLHYQTYDVGEYLVDGENVIGVYIAEGWYAGRLGRPGTSNIWGDRLGFLAQLEVDGRIVCATNATWEYLDGPIIAAEIYNGEIFDTTLDDPAWSTTSFLKKVGCDAEELPFPSAELISPEAAPVRRVMEVKPQQIIVTPSGKKVLDFGQNLVGWLKILVDIPGKEGDVLVIKHAEVLEHGELGTRPLRTAKAQNIVRLGGKTKGYESRFSWYGFRYVFCTQWPSLESELSNQIC